MMVIIGDFERLIMGRQGTRLEGVVCEGNINICSFICYWWLFDDADDDKDYVMMIYVDYMQINGSKEMPSTQRAHVPSIEYDR